MIVKFGRENDSNSSDGESSSPRTVRELSLSRKVLEAFGERDGLWKERNKVVKKSLQILKSLHLTSSRDT